MSAGARPTARRGATLALAVALVAAACSSGDDDAQDVRTASLGPRPVESGMPDDPKPERGGQLVYGLEARTDNLCLPEAQMAISGMQIARAIYDPLTVPDAKGGYQPYLAKSLEHSDDYRTWTITLRPDITFHDGSALDATVVKNNLDAFRGAYDNREALLFSFVFQNIDSVEVVNELAVRVRTKVPWVAFPAALYSSGRVAMVSQSQLDATAVDCATKPVGTGPFEFVSWDADDSIKVQRNPGYWQEAPDGEPYPYLNAIEFRPVENTDGRVAALQRGDINMMHTSTVADMDNSLRQLRDDDKINLLISEERTEVSYVMLNTASKPLDDVEVRRAISQAVDRDLVNEKQNDGFSTVANGPFAPEVLGHVEDPGFPEHDPATAKKVVDGLKAKGRDTTLVMISSTSPASIREAVIIKDMLEAAGFTIELEIETEVDLIDRALEGSYDLVTFRNQPGEDPDMNYVWWYGEGNPVNFGRFNDQVINDNLDKGRVTADREARRKAYEAINRRFAEQAYNVWLWHSPWAVAEAPNVHGILGPDLPGGEAAPGRLVTGHPVHGIWIENP